MKYAWKEKRRAQKRYEREQRRYARYNRLNRANNYGDNNFYAYNDNYGDDFRFNSGSDWKQQLLRAVIGNVLGGDFDGGNGLNVLQQFQPNRIKASNYERYQHRPAYYNSPLYTGYDNQVSDPGIEDLSTDGGSGLGGLLNELPIAELIGQYTGDNEFVSGLLGSFLTQGYDQGFLAGRSAREYGDDNGSYNDPYAYQGGVYDPYSASLGQNRQLLSEGYALGYQDALNGNTDYDPASEGNVDLVSLLLNSALSRV